MIIDISAYKKDAKVNLNFYFHSLLYVCMSDREICNLLSVGYIFLFLNKWKKYAHIFLGTGGWHTHNVI